MFQAGRFERQKQEQRKKEWRKGIDSEEARKKREDNVVTIRRTKREEGLQKRRFTNNNPNAKKQLDPFLVRRLQQIPELVDQIQSNDPKDQLEATSQFRRLLSIDKTPPIQDVINSGVVPILVRLLMSTEHPNIQFEAAWALTNVASGSSVQTRVVIENGAVPVFVELLSSPYDDVREQAVWALGNIAGDSPHCRDFVLQYGALEPLLRNLDDREKVSMRRNATWTLSNLVRGKPQPKFELVAPALPILARLIRSNDEEVLTDACWALSYLSDGTNDKIQMVIEAGVAVRLVELLMHTSSAVQTPALRTVGNIVTGDDMQTQIILNVSSLPCLLVLLGSPKKGIRKEACWTISNITAGNKHQIESVIEHGIFPKIISLLQTAEFDIKKEAAWAISNATNGGTPSQIKYLVKQDCIPPMVALLNCYDVRIISVILEGLENILKVGSKMAAAGETEDGENPYVKLIDEAEGIDRLDELQNHESAQIREKVLTILEDYFDAVDEDAAFVPQVDQTTNTFKFGTGNIGPDAGGYKFS